MKKFSKLVVASAVALSFSGAANAALTDQYLQAGNNVLEDDSGEYVFRFNGAGFDVVTGAVAVGDLFVGFLDIPIINGVNIDSDGNQFAGLFLSELTAITDVGTSGAIGSTVFPDTYDSGTFEFESVSNAVWGALLGVDLVALGGSVGADLTDAFAIFYEDSSNSLDLFTQDYATSLAAITGGDFVLAGGLTGLDGTFVVSTASPLDNTEFDPTIHTQRVPGVTSLGNFGVNNTALYEGFSSIDINSNIIGSGFNLVTDLDFHPVQDDTQFSFNAVPVVPEPSSLALMGLGLLGMSAAQRRRKA